MLHFETKTIPIPASSKSKSILLLLLVVDTPTPPVVEAFGDYTKVFATLFEKAAGVGPCVPETGEGMSGEFITIECYDVIEGNYPTDERVRQAQGLLITGSVASAYEYESVKWISNLVSYIATLPAISPTLKIVGTCFGHQVISIAYGSTCEKNALGWEIGVRTLELTKFGSGIFGGAQTLNVQQMHQDHVPTVPESFHVLGSTSICPNQGFVKLIPSADNDNSSSDLISPQSIAILTLQGHPEFTSGLVNKNLDGKLEKGTICKELIGRSREAANEREDGVKIGRVILEMMGF